MLLFIKNYGTRNRTKFFSFIIDRTVKRRKVRRMDDSAIVDLYWQRDESALRETETKYGPYINKIAMNILSDPQDSEESVSDVYMRAWSSMPTYRPGVLSAYLAKLARQCSIDIFRKRNSEKRRASEYALSLSELAECTAGQDTPDSIVELKQLTEAVRSFLSTLPEENSRIFICRYFFMDSIKEICRCTGYGESKVKSTLFRIRQGLRAHLQKEGFIP